MIADIDECAKPEVHQCGQICNNTPGGLVNKTVHVLQFTCTLKLLSCIRGLTRINIAQFDFDDHIISSTPIFQDPAQQSALPCDGISDGLVLYLAWVWEIGNSNRVESYSFFA